LPADSEKKKLGTRAGANEAVAVAKAYDDESAAAVAARWPMRESISKER
jgi:hypothetical protein